MDMDSQLRQLERRFGPIFKLGRISPILLFETHLKVGCEKQHGFDHITLMIVANSQLDETVVSLKCLGDWSSAGMEPGFPTGSLQSWSFSSSLLLLVLLDPLTSNCFTSHPHYSQVFLSSQLNKPETSPNLTQTSFHRLLVLFITGCLLLVLNTLQKKGKGTKEHHKARLKQRAHCQDIYDSSQSTPKMFSLALTQ